MSHAYCLHALLYMLLLSPPLLASLVRAPSLFYRSLIVSIAYCIDRLFHQLLIVSIAVQNDL